MLRLSGLVLRGGRHALQPIDLSLERGVHAFVHDDDDVLDSLMAALAGVVAPRAGTVTLSGREPSREPELRAAIGSLFCDEPPLTLGVRVLDHVRTAERLRGARSGAALEDGGHPDALADLALRQAETLGLHERRRVATHLALSLDRPRLLALAEPLARLSPEDTARLVDALRKRVEGGTPCVLGCRTVESARHLARQVTDLRPKVGTS